MNKPISKGEMMKTTNFAAIVLSAIKRSAVIFLVSVAIMPSIVSARYHVYTAVRPVGDGDIGKKGSLANLAGATHCFVHVEQRDHDGEVIQRFGYGFYPNGIVKEESYYENKLDYLGYFTDDYGVVGFIRGLHIGQYHLHKNNCCDAVIAALKKRGISIPSEIQKAKKKNKELSDAGGVVAGAVGAVLGGMVAVEVYNEGCSIQ